MFDKLKIKYPDVKFDIILRAMYVLNQSLIATLDEGEMILSHKTWGYPIKDRVSFDCRIITSKHREIANRVEIKRKYIPNIELVYLIAETYKPHRYPDLLKDD